MNTFPLPVEKADLEELQRWGSTMWKAAKGLRFGNHVFSLQALSLCGREQTVILYYWRLTCSFCPCLHVLIFIQFCHFYYQLIRYGRGETQGKKVWLMLYKIVEVFLTAGITGRLSSFRKEKVELEKIHSWCIKQGIFLLEHATFSVSTYSANVNNY